MFMCGLFDIKFRYFLILMFNNGLNDNKFYVLFLKFLLIYIY